MDNNHNGMKDVPTEDSLGYSVHCIKNVSPCNSKGPVQDREYKPVDVAPYTNSEFLLKFDMS